MFNVERVFLGLSSSLYILVNSRAESSLQNRCGETYKAESSWSSPFSIRHILSKFSLFLLYVNEHLPVCIYVHHRYAVSTEARVVLEPLNLEL